MLEALQQLKEVRSSLSNLLNTAKEHNNSYANGYTQGLEHSIELLNIKIEINEQNLRLHENFSENNTATIEATI